MADACPACCTQQAPGHMCAGSRPQTSGASVSPSRLIGREHGACCSCHDSFGTMDSPPTHACVRAKPQWRQVAASSALSPSHSGQSRERERGPGNGRGVSSTGTRSRTSRWRRTFILASKEGRA